MNETGDAADALRESEARFRALTNATFDVVYRMSADWTEMQRLEGRHFIADTLEPSRSWLEKYIHRDDQPLVLEAIKRAVQAKTTFELEHRVVRADGTLGWTHSRAIPILDLRGEIVEWFGAARDVTPRKEAEVALEQRAAQQAAIAALGQTALAETTIDDLMDQVVHCVAQTLRTELAKVLELAPGGGELLLRAGVGWNPGLVGRAIVGAERDSQAGFTLLADGPVVVTDLRTETRFTGRPLLLDHDVVSGMSCVIQGSDGRPYGVLGTHTRCRRDFSDDDINFFRSVANVLAAAIVRRRAEGALRESEERYRRTFELAGSGVAHIGLDRKFIRVNRRLCEILGYPEHELIGMTAREISHPGDLDKINSQRPKLYAGEVDHVYVEKRYVRKDKAVVWVALSMTVERDAGGKPLYEIAIFDDITKRKDAEKALAESEERFRTLADNMNQLAWMAGPGGAFLWFNKRWHDYTGATVEEIDASNWSMRVHPEHAPRVIEHSQRCLRQGQAWEDTFPLKGRTGEYRWFLGRAVPIKDDAGRLLCWFGTMTDITELEQRNAQLQRLSAQLTTIEQHERRRLAITLHDGLQQLIVAAKLRLPQCLEKDGSEQMQRIDRLLDDAIEAVRSLAWELSPPALGISTLPQALEWLADWFQTQHGFHTRIPAAEAIPPLPEHAKSLLFSAVRELLLNCVKHSGVKAATLELHTDAVHELQILVADDGAGFDPAKVSYGFGLSSIRERLGALGGRLVIESAPGAGARCTMSLPLPNAQTP